MKGQVVGIYKVFDGTEKKIVIPVYQRNYDWTPRQCERLFDDIEEMIDAGRSKHFFGAVVGNPEDSFTWVVIDGQQRMTTVSLLMLALVHAIEAGDIEPGDPTLAGKLMRNYLEFRDGSDQKFKLKPVKDDKSSYARLFGPEEYFNEKSKITVNYRYFRERLKATSFDARTIWNDGISNLEVMLLDLEKEDDPQRIFESINSTGLALKESDKIRNFILMGLNQREQNEIYEKYWNEMEKNVSFATDGFIRWYLVSQTSKTPKESDLFEAFKIYVKKSGRSVKDIVKDLHRFSNIARELQTATTGYKEIDRRLRRANSILSDVVKPFLWLTYKDFKTGVIDGNDFAEVVAVIETYIFRRIMAGVAANAMNKIFANSYSELQKLRKNNERYSDVLAYMLLNRQQSGRLPDDVEFLTGFKSRDVYRMRQGYRSYFFDVMERGDSKDVVDIARYITDGDLTIEHIMPQKLSNQWRAELGADAEEIHSTWVNRAANLTITGYNSEYSNHSFEKKLTMEGGFQDSPYFLNAYVKQQTTWGVQQLEERSEILASRALELWPYPTTDFEPPKLVLPMEPMGLETSFKGEEIAAVELEGAKTAVNSWRDMLVTVFRVLLELDRDGVLATASESPLLMDENVAELAANWGEWRQVDPALVVYIANDTNTKVALLRKVCEKIGYDPYEISFYLRPSSEELEENQAEARPQSPYEDLIALKPLIDEVVGSQFSQSETAQLREALSEAVEKHTIDSYTEVLGGKNLPTFIAEVGLENLTVTQALSCLTDMYRTQQTYGSVILHQPILDGLVSDLLGVLEHSDSE